LCQASAGGIQRQAEYNNTRYGTHVSPLAYFAAVRFATT
jgi:hypothetical protein